MKSEEIFDSLEKFVASNSWSKSETPDENGQRHRHFDPAKAELIRKGFDHAFSILMLQDFPQEKVKSQLSSPAAALAKKSPAEVYMYGAQFAWLMASSISREYFERREGSK